MPTTNRRAIVVGDRVRVLHTAGLTGRVVELRGPLGPKGAQIYRLRLWRKPRPAYVEVREDQLELLPRPPAAGGGAGGRAASSGALVASIPSGGVRPVDSVSFASTSLPLPLSEPPTAAAHAGPFFAVPGGLFPVTHFPVQMTFPSTPAEMRVGGTTARPKRAAPAGAEPPGS